MTAGAAASGTALSPGATEWVLSFADDEHFIGSRHAAWIGLGPFLEEDLAFCSIAQDELGHAIALYELLTDDLDRFALLRPAADYRSAWLCELACEQWNYSLVRHWLYDQAEALRWASLESSSVPALQTLSKRAEREEVFHRDHADLYLSRLADGDEPCRHAVAAAIAELLPYAVALWEPVAGEAEALADGVATASSADLARDFEAAITADLRRWGFDPTWPQPIEGQNARTTRSAGFGDFLASLQEVILLDTDATW